MNRRAGILLHPTSLPGPYGIGEIGPAARAFVDWLHDAGQSIWQVLPLVPIDEGGAPYSSPSAFARNALIVSIDDLVADGWLTESERPSVPGDRTRVDFPAAFRARMPALRRAADRVVAKVDLDAFVNKERAWLDDWALYAALSAAHGPCWTRWPKALRDRDPKALRHAREAHEAEIHRQIALQWLFAQQWQRLRAYAAERGVVFWGDVPFFVSGESVDTWAHRDLFRLDREGKPTVVSGVPPDAFSETGQLWGHPLYDEEAQKKQGYRWWIDRIAATEELVELVRLDHFRGLAAYWEVQAGAETAMEGRWIPGPGQALIDVLREKFGRMPFFAEDLGIITPDVEALRDDNDLPGMAVLQFAFGDPDDLDNPYIPHAHRRNIVVYPGTHDNDTCVGWYRTASEQARDHLRRYLSTDARDVAGDFVRCAYRSVADTAIVAMQDVLGLDSDARMNVPSLPEGNWGWRMREEALDPALARRLREQARITHRLPPTGKDGADQATEGAAE